MVPSAAPCGRAVAKGRATGRTNTLFIDFLQLPAIPAVRLSVLIFFFRAIAGSTLDCVSLQKQREPWVSELSNRGNYTLPFCPQHIFPGKGALPPSEIPAPGRPPNRKELA